MSETLGTFIQQRLAALGWKQADLVRCTGLSPTYISNLTTDHAPGSQRGGYLPEPDKLETLARCLQCSRAELLVAMGYLSADEAGDPMEQRIKENYRRLPDVIKDVYATIGQSLDHKFGKGHTRARNPKVLAADDPREDTAVVTSAGKLGSKNKDKGSKKRSVNGE